MAAITRRGQGGPRRGTGTADRRLLRAAGSHPGLSKRELARQVGGRTIDVLEAIRESLTAGDLEWQEVEYLDARGARCTRQGIFLTSAASISAEDPDRAAPEDEGSSLRQARRGADWTQNDLAQYLSETQSVVSDWERGKRRLSEAARRFIRPARAGDLPPLAQPLLPGQTPGAQLRKAREDAGWTQRALARRLGVDNRQLSEWERDRAPVPERLRKPLRRWLQGAPPAPESPPLPAGTELRRRRREAGLLQRELAELVGVRRDTLARWERGRTISHRYRERLHSALDDLPDAPPTPRPIPGADLRRRRREAKLTQAALATLVGVTQGAVAAGERPGGQVPASRRARVREALRAVRPLTRGDTLRKMRAAAGLTQRDLAERLGVTTASVSNLERDRPVSRHLNEAAHRELAAAPPPSPAPPPRLAGAELRKMREATGLNQRAAAGLLKISPSLLCQWERERQPVPDRRVDEVRARLAAAVPAEPAPVPPTPEEIQAALRWAGWTLDQFGERAGGVSKHQVSAWKNDRQRVPPTRVPRVWEAIREARRLPRVPTEKTVPRLEPGEIHELRARMGWSRQELGAKLGVSAKVVFYWQARRTPVPPAQAVEIRRLLRLRRYRRKEPEAGA